MVSKARETGSAVLAGKNEKALPVNTGSGVNNEIACRTGAIFLRFQESGGKREVSAERESRATG